MALRERGQLAVLLNSLVEQALTRTAGTAPDRRNLRTWRQFVLGALVQRSVRLVRVAQAVWPARRVQSVKTTAAALGYLLNAAQWAQRPFTTRWLLAAVERVAPEQWATYRGSVLAVIDATEYPKRSRGQGKRGRPRQHIGRVRRVAKGQPKGRAKQRSGKAPRPPRVATTYGYVDVWGGLVLKGQQFVPLARLLYSNRHPQLKSQNRVEEAVIGMLRGLARRLGFRVLLLGDRGLGRKELLIRLARAEQAFVFRIDADIQVGPPGQAPDRSLAAYLAQQPRLGRARWPRCYRRW